MALSAKISTIYLRDADDDTWRYKFTVPSSMDFSLGQVNYNSAYDEAIDGSLRTNIRGYRIELSLNYQKVLSSDVEKSTNQGSSYSTSSLATFFDDLITSLATNGDSYIEASLTDDFSTSGAEFKLIPDSLTYGTAFINQIARGNSSMKFAGQEVLTSINTNIQAPST